MTWRGRKDALTPDRLDARLAYAFLLGGHRSELAVAVQALDGDQPVFLPTKVSRIQRLDVCDAALRVLMPYYCGVAACSSRS